MKRLLSLFLAIAFALSASAQIFHGPAYHPAPGGGGFPTNGVLDTFTGTNGTDLTTGNWADLATSVPLEIQSNQATGTSQDLDNFGRWEAASYGPDVEVYITINTLPTQDGDAVFLMARLTGDVADFQDRTGYELSYNFNSSGDDTLQFDRRSGGTGANIGAAITQEFAAGDSFGFTLTGGDTLQAYYKPAAGSWAALSTPRVDGTPLATSAGKLGIDTYSTAVRLDDFGGGTQ